MMIAPTGASPYAAASALDRQLRQGSDASDDDASSPSPDAGPGVVVTLGQGEAAPSTYDATGRLSGASAAGAPDDDPNDEAPAQADQDSVTA